MDELTYHKYKNFGTSQDMIGVVDGLVQNWLQAISSNVCGCQGWGKYYSGTRPAQNGKHEYTKNIVFEYYSSTDFPVLVLVCSVLAPALVAASAGAL